MNKVERARNISIDSAMQRMGYKPVNSTPVYTWYNSPFRGESKPSFVINKKRNTYKDWGDKSKRGDVIQMVMDIQEISFSEALDFLVTDDREFVPYVPENIPNEQPGVLIVDEKYIQNKYLIAYAQSRAIDVDLLRRYCSEVKFIITSRPAVVRTAIGFVNNKGGWELRYDTLKISSSPKTWRTITAEKTDSADVFEGFFNFLSHLQWMGWESPKHTTFVMNSLAFASFIVDETKDFNLVTTYLDNDAAGDKALEEYFNDGKYIHANKDIYPSHGDYNDFIKENLLNIN